MARSKLEMSPAVKRDWERVVAAAEYAAANPAPGAMAFTIRGYIRQGGRWYVEVLVQDDPEPKALDGAKLIQTVEEAKLRDGFGSGVQDQDVSPNDTPGTVTLGISRKGISRQVQAPDHQEAQGHKIPTGQNSEEAED